MLDVAEAFTAVDISHTNFISQHYSSGLPCYLLFKLSTKSSRRSSRYYQMVPSLLVSSLESTVAN